MAAAWAAGDRPGFVAALSPGETRRAEVMWDTWLSLAQVRVTAGALGGSGLAVSWSLPGERVGCTDVVTVAVSDAGPRLVPGARWPLWWSHPVDVASTRVSLAAGASDADAPAASNGTASGSTGTASGSTGTASGSNGSASGSTGTASGSNGSASERAGWVSVLAAPAVAATDRRAWLMAAASAVERLGRAELAPWLSAWDGALVVAIPSDAYEFARVSGVTAGVAATGAATWQNRGEAARIVVNPAAVGRLSVAEATSLLVHEGVHAVSGSSWRVPGDPRAQVLAEGLAESVACAEDSARRAANAALADAAASQSAGSWAGTSGAGAGGGLSGAGGAASGATSEAGDAASGAGGALSGAGASGWPTLDPAAGPDPAAYARAQRIYERAVQRWGRGTVHAWLDDWAHASPPTVAELGSLV